MLIINSCDPELELYIGREVSIYNFLTGKLIKGNNGSLHIETGTGTYTLNVDDSYVHQVEILEA